MKSIKTILFQAILWPVFQVAMAQDCVEDFKSKFQHIQSMQAHFHQVIQGQSQVTSSGVMAIKRPNQCRWETQKPMPQLMIADGKTVFIYDEALEQVTLRDQQKISQHSAMIFLSDLRQCEKTYRIHCSIQGGFTWYTLTSKSSHAAFKEMIFKFKQDRWERLMFVDPLGQRTEITFDHIQLNHAISTTLFKFKPPSGVDVIDEQRTGA